ncbi:COL10A [Lepeophtheirus salmonis]|uniref:COL10A n=1 Tax=Lepeophtheirus salmonis TaxID=72036 RepID=A0A7R8CPF4_LEPSM|nr:COL10A [Lepeophtheirus salmonis]CAF2883500.1 COL10A [Lepeophtheirus salmonis]
MYHHYNIVFLISVLPFGVTQGFHLESSSSGWDDRLDSIVNQDTVYKDVFSRLKYNGGESWSSLGAVTSKSSEKGSYLDPSLSLEGKTLSFHSKKPVAFTAMNSEQTSPGTRVLFNKTLTHINRGWNKRLSVFRVESPGLYFFTFSAVGDSDDWKITLYLNNGPLTYTSGHSRGNSGTNSLVVPLNVEDRVWLELTNGRIEEGSVSFSGFRIGDITHGDMSRHQGHEEVSPIKSTRRNDEVTPRIPWRRNPYYYYMYHGRN